MRRVQRFDPRPCLDPERGGEDQKKVLSRVWESSVGPASGLTERSSVRAPLSRAVQTEAYANELMWLATKHLKELETAVEEVAASENPEDKAVGLGYKRGGDVERPLGSEGRRIPQFEPRRRLMRCAAG